MAKKSATAPTQSKAEPAKEAVGIRKKRRISLKTKTRHEAQRMLSSQKKTGKKGLKPILSGRRIANIIREKVTSMPEFGERGTLRFSADALNALEQIFGDKMVTYANRAIAVQKGESLATKSMTLMERHFQTLVAVDKFKEPRLMRGRAAFRA